MPLFVLGISHQTAPVAIRERLAFTRDELPEALRELRRRPGVRECAILSTCNRTELYLEGNNNTAETAVDWLHRWHRLAPAELHSHLYRKTGAECVAHLIEVTAGMESMVIGEPQIGGQVKRAWATAREQKCLAARLDRMFQHAFAAAKRVRSETGIGHNPVTLPFAALKLARQIFGELGELRAALVGAGEMVTECAEHFRSSGLKGMMILNRTRQTAEVLARKYGADAYSLDELDTVLPEADVVVSSTASDTPVLGTAAFRRALKRRRHRPMFVLDLAVPRDVEPSAGELSDVYLYTVDDLQAIVAAGVDRRGRAMKQGAAIVAEEADTFSRWLNLTDADGALKAIRARAEDDQQRLLTQARQELAAGKEPEEVMKRLAHRLSNSLLHTPSVRLREAAENADEKLLEAAEYFFLEK